MRRRRWFSPNDQNWLGFPDRSQLIELDELKQLCGRGLLLIRTLMDQVTFNKNGSEITMVKLAAVDAGHD